MNSGRLSVAIPDGILSATVVRNHYSDTDSTAPIILPLGSKLPWCVVRDGHRIISAIGDSIIAGHPHHDGRQDFYTKDYAASSIWFWLRKMLPDYFISNYAVGSTTSTYWLSDGSGQLRTPPADMVGPYSSQSKIHQTALILRPQYLFFGVGGNDMGAGFPIEMVADNVSAVCDVAAENNIIPVILSVPFLGKAHAAQSEERRHQIKQLNELYSNMVKRKNYEAHFVAYSHLLAAYGITRDEFLSDNTHPNEVGYKIIASEIMNTVPFIAPRQLRWIVFHWGDDNNQLPANFAMPKRIRIVFALPDCVSSDRGYDPEATSGYTTTVAQAVANSDMRLGYICEVLVPNKPQSTYAFAVPEYLASSAYEVLYAIVECYDSVKGGCTGFSRIEYVYV